jgi:hypothetical protein
VARREFARIGTDMPDEDSIKALTVEAGWLYDRLYLRPEMSRCGIIPFRPAAWALLGRNATEPKVRRWLRELAAGGHLVIDEPMAEVLIRTFVRWDGLLGQPNVVANMVYDFHLIASKKIRLAFLQEFRRIWDLDIPDGWRGGWCLAVGHYPRAKHSKDDPAQWPNALPADALTRLRKAVGTGFRDEFAAALGSSDVKPFDEHSTHGIPEPFTEPSVNPSQMALA